MITKTTQKVYASNLPKEGRWTYLAKGATSLMWEPKAENANDEEVASKGKFVKTIDVDSLKNVLTSRKMDMWVITFGRLTILRESGKP